MINRAFTFTTIILFLGFVIPCQAQNKVALVIGNAAYQDSPLRNPVNDATDIAQALRSVGFTVTLKTNLDKMNMENAVRSFRAGLKTGDVALFYYSGHGMQVNGINYLIPVGESIYSEVEIPYKSMEAQFVIDYMQQAGTSVNIIILDACRDNPFKAFRSQGRGFVPAIAPQGTFIAYSTAPGTVAFDGDGRNSPYTKYLISSMKEPGVQIEDMFKEVRNKVMSETGKQQVPWESSSLVEDFTFCPGTATPSNLNPTETLEMSFQCGDNYTVNHVAGNVAPVNKTVTYRTVKTDLSGSWKCWITQNLGADQQATSVSDGSEKSAGWYWQFNRPQGYMYVGTMRTPDTKVWASSIYEESHWQLNNDPCSILLGTSWRLPTIEEWRNVDENGRWNDFEDAYLSVLKLNYAGVLSYIDGSLVDRGSSGVYWSSAQNDATRGRGLKGIYYKAFGFPVRCLRD